MIVLRQQYIERFLGLPGVQHCAAHDGELDDDEVARVGQARTPAVLVTCLGAEDIDDELGQEATAYLQWVAVVIARAPDRVREGERSAGDVAAAIALRIAYELRYGAPFDGVFEAPSNVRVANMVGTRAAKRGHAIWAVTWRQPASIRPEELEPVLHDLRLIHTDYDLPPHPGVDMSSDTVMTEEP